MDFTETYGDTVSGVAAAARSGCRERLRQLLRLQRRRRDGDGDGDGGGGGGSGVDCRDNRGWHALHHAAAAGSAGCVRDILRYMAASAGGRRAYVNSQTHEGESALYLAAQRGHLAAVRPLLRARADVNQLTNDLSCPLYAAVDGGHKEIVQLLVSKGAEVNGTHTACCWTCLHLAVYKGYEEIVRILVGVCRLEAVDDHNITPLFVAAQYGRHGCLEILANAGANVNAQAADLATPLMLASQEGHERCLEVLLDHGADPNLPCSHDWPQLPIHAAAEFGHRRILERLIAVTDRACDRAEGMVSPMYMAVKRSRRSVTELLLRAGYSPDAQDCTRILGVCSPLSYALSLANEGPCSAPVVSLMAAGARLCEDNWQDAMIPPNTLLLDLILQYRRIPKPWKVGGAPSPPGCAWLSQRELRGLVRAAVGTVHHAPCWLPRLLGAGLEPSLLLKPRVFEESDGDSLNYLLAFVNWSTLRPPLKRILERRLEEKSWSPHACFESIPCLSHLCRLKVSEVVGRGTLSSAAGVQQLPVPPLLHRYLQFSEIRPPAVDTPPSSPSWEIIIDNPLI